MANINIKSYNEILGDMIRKIVADTPVNDINKGSVLLTLLEAAAANDYENNTAILNVLELLNIDALRNNDLDAYGSNLGLTRKTASKASGFVVVSDSTITKRSTSLYPIKPAPITTSTAIHVNDASTWGATGTLYIGRDTSNFEGPISYTSIVDNGTFFTINLASALEKDHLISESVVDGQGTTDRQILAGNIVKVPANNINPEIEYTVLRDAVIPAGEDTSDDISVVAIKAGSLGNAGINSIILFNTLPFAGATVTNTNAFTNGDDAETDERFRDRIKAYSSTLARGTKGAILAAIDGVSDETDGKQVESAVITEPAIVGDPSIAYIDDGQGFQPSFDGQSVDLLVAEASGNEEFLQLANHPLPRPQSINTAESPFLFVEGMELKVEVDGIEESVTFTSADFTNISSATISEIIIAINDRATTFKCRFSNESAQMLLYPVDHKTETIQVISSGTDLDANLQLKFPVNEFSYIKLYQNNTLLKEIQKPAILTTTAFSTWNITGSGNLILAVDGTPNQDQTLTTADFGGTSFNSLSLTDYVTAFNNKYAGITASETTTGRMVLVSNKEGSSSSLSVIGGTYLTKMFSGQTTDSTGQNSDFALNRQTGNLQMKTTIATGDIITAGSDDTKGSITSAQALTNGTFNVSTDASNRAAAMMIVNDAARVQPRSINLAVGGTITLSDQGSNVMRIMSSTTSTFRTLQPNDYIYITNRGHVAGTGAEAWIDVLSSGLYKIKAKGEHLTGGTDSYIEVDNVNMVVGGPYTVVDNIDIQAFYSDVYPQIWLGTMTSNPAVATISDVVDSINDNIKGVVASTFRTNFIKLTSTTEEGGSIAIPISIANAVQLYASGGTQQAGAQSHVANLRPDADTIPIFERTAPVNANIWLDRYTYTDVRGSLTASEEPSLDGSGTYSETLTDTALVDFTTDVTYDNLINVTGGSNKKQIRDIRTIIDADNVGTRHDIPRSLFDYDSGDEYQVAKHLEFSSDDSLVAVIDNDTIAKTIDISFSRTGQVNGGSQAGVSLPTSTTFSADDTDNETGIDFGTLGVWGTLASQTNTNFNDYAAWFRARNWYDVNSSVMMIRAAEYGPVGSNIRFKIEHPATANATKSFTHVNLPNSILGTYKFGSGAAVVTNIAASDNFTVTDLGSDNFRYTFPVTATVANAAVGDVISIGTSSGFSSANQGIYRVNAKSDGSRTVDVYNPDGVATIVGVNQIETATTVADSSDSLDGTHFTLTAPNGDTIKFWYDNNDSGTIEPAIGTTTRSHEINVATNDSAITVATLTAAAMLGDAAITTATNAGGTSAIITLTWTNDGPSVIGANGASSPGFSYAIPTPGITATFETLAAASSLLIYPITDNDTATIVAEINTSSILVAVEETSGTVLRATREEDSVAVDELGFGHDPDPVNLVNEYISLHDSVNWILTFQNANPNFEFKNAFDLVGVSAAYVMNTTTNEDSTTGEYFKLIPVTTTNLKHHMEHKALSQLEIVSDVDFSDNNKKMQIKSELLGSDGAIEIVGGRASKATFKIIGDSQIATESSVNYLEVLIPAAPRTLSPGHHVILSNDSGVERLSRNTNNDTMDVVEIAAGSTYEYRYDDKTTGFVSGTAFTIVDANGVDAGSYPTPGLVWRWTHDAAATALLDVQPGNLVNPTGTFSGWDNTNLTYEAGDSKIGGWPIVKVDAASKYFDIVNPQGVAMGSTAIGGSGTILISTSPIIEWRVDHSSKVTISTVTIVSNVATATTAEPHRLNVGDTFVGTDIPAAVSPDTSTVVSVVNGNQFTYASTNGDVTVAPGGFLLKTGETETKYKIEDLGYNDMLRLSRASGDSPLFTGCGVAVDDLLILGGDTFNSINSGEFRVLAVDATSIIYQNTSGVEELDTFVDFNNFGTTVNWTASSDQITSVAGAFRNLALGDWVKKETDNDTFFNQVTAFNTGNATTATAITLANPYSGITSTNAGHALDQSGSINTGVTLRDVRDIRILEGDAVRTLDSLFISENTNANWFSASNSGTFSIAELGTNASDGRVFLRVINIAGIAEADRQLDIDNTTFSITESDDNKFTTIKQVHNVAMDETDSEKRTVYLTPGNRVAKWSESNVTSLTSLGKIGYSTDIITGVDGYLFYTGLLQKVQRIIDGFEPDSANFPGTKAIGSAIETLPPLPRKVTVSLDVTTQDGVNLTEISDELKSVVINYVTDLGVGEDVILSDIIVRIKNVDGVAAVTFITPEPSEERISISSDEKAFIESNDVSIT